MTICTSGDNLNTKLSSTGWLTNLHIAHAAYNYFIEHGTHKRIFKEKEIEVHCCDLTDDNVFGWCEQCDDNHWLVTIHNDLQITEHYKTLFHEFQHIIQDIYGIKCQEVRENEAYQIEGTMYREMCDSPQTVH